MGRPAPRTREMCCRPAIVHVAPGTEPCSVTAVSRCAASWPALPSFHNVCTLCSRLFDPAQDQGQGSGGCYRTLRPWSSCHDQDPFPGVYACDKHSRLRCGQQGQHGCAVNNTATAPLNEVPVAISLAAISDALSRRNRVYFEFNHVRCEGIKGRCNPPEIS